jgi:hypothetical protein
MTERLTNPDEFVLEDVKMFHLEQMNETAYWAGIYLNNGKLYHLNIHGDNLRVYWSDETLEEPAQDTSTGAPDAL